MPVVIDKILGGPLLHDHPIRSVSSDPASAKEGSLILNTVDNKIKIYYSGQWQDLHTLTGFTTGIGFMVVGTDFTIT